MFKQEKCIVSEFQWLKDQDQGVPALVSFEGCKNECFMPLGYLKMVCWQSLLAIFGVP